MQHHHKLYENNETYIGTLTAIKDNYMLFKKNVPNFINYTDDIDTDTYTIYNKMYENIMYSDITQLLDKIFDKKIIKKGTIVYSSFYTGINFNDYISNNSYDNNVINKMLYEDYLNMDNNESRLYKVFRMFDDIQRRKGGLYTTSCVKSWSNLRDEKYDPDNLRNQIENIQNIVLSVSNTYLGKTADISKILLICTVNNDYSMYNLHPENYVNRILFKRILSNILLNGKIKYNLTYKELAETRQAGKKAAFVAYPWRCTEVLDNDIYVKKNDEYTKYELDANCVSGYWDGNSSLHEYILNHFILLYNDHHPSNPIHGYIGRDSSWDDYTNSNVSASEIVWFNNEKVLTPTLIYFKNYVISNQFEFYKVLRNYLKIYHNEILSQESTLLDRNELLEFAKNLCDIIDSHTKKPQFLKVDKNLSFESFLNKIYESNPLKVIPETNELFNKVSMKGGNINYKQKYKKYKSKYLRTRNNLY